MAAILIDALLLLLLLVVTAFAVRELVAGSAAGVRHRQIQNRRRIELEQATACSLHGPHAEGDLVRLPSGDTLCPQCYREIQDAGVI